MKKFRTIILCMLMTAAVCAGLFATGPAVFARAENTMKRNKKIVSMVFDDSGSMENEERWAAANYAVQAMAALMNGEDELYIIMMNDQENPIRVNLADPGAAVQEIRTRCLYDPSNGTPSVSVDKAMEVLSSVDDQEPSTQYWLFIITDGEFDLESADALVNKHKGTTMPNGSTVNIDYLEIGKTGSGGVVSDEKAGVWSYKSSSGNITDSVSEIANQVSGRMTFEDADVTIESANSIRVHTDLPLYSISILSQKSGATVTACKGTEALQVDRNISLTTPVSKKGRTPVNTISGNAAVVSNGDRIIPPGDYTITFSEAVDPANVKLLYEPAIDLLMRAVDKNGDPLDSARIAPGDKVDIEVVPVIPGTEEEIPVGDLPEGTAFAIEYEVDGNIVASSDTNKVTDVEVMEGSSLFRGSMTIPGYAPIIRETAAFTAVRYGLIAEIPEDPVIYRRTSFGKTDVNGNSIVFRITRNDQVMTKKDMENDDISLQVTDLSVDNSNVTGFLNSFGNTPADCRIRVEEDGTIYLMPARPTVLALAPFLIDCGDYHVTVAVNQDETLTGEADFTIQGGWGEWKYPFILLILLLLILYLLYIFFVKYKFHGQKVHVDYYKMLTDGSGIKEKNKGGTYTLDFFSPDLFLPRRACHRNIMGLDVVADGMVVRVTGKSIQSGYAKYGQAAVSEKMALKRLSTVVSRLTPTRDEKGKAKDTADQYLTGKPIYFQRGPKDREIIAIYMEE